MDENMNSDIDKIVEKITETRDMLLNISDQKNPNRLTFTNKSTCDLFTKACNNLTEIVAEHEFRD